MTIRAPQRRIPPPLRVIGAAALVCVAHAAAQSEYPSRPVRIIVPSAVGGGNDLIARMIAQGLTERLGRQTVVENRTGAGTVIGSEIVAKSKPDGYTLLMAPAALVTIPATGARVPYDLVRDFAPVTQAASLPGVVVIHPSVPAKTLTELIVMARAKPAQLLFSSAGRGTHPHLSMELLASMAQIKLVHVAYRGTTPGLTDLLAGQVSMTTANIVQALPHIRAGRMRALGVTTLKRNAAAPDIPTIAESGLPGYESVQWYGLLAPAATPADVIARLHAETVKILGAAEPRTRLAADGADVVASAPEEFAAFLKMELSKWQRIAREAGIEPE